MVRWPWHPSKGEHVRFSSQQKTNKKVVVVVAAYSRNSKKNPSSSGKVPLRGNKKDNVWSVDNEAAIEEREKESGEKERRKRQSRGPVGDKILVSGSMPAELETLLQTQEPVIRPSWNTFASSVSGIWKGVGAVFSPMTAQMEPIDVGTKVM